MSALITLLLLAVLGYVIFELAVSGRFWGACTILRNTARLGLGLVVAGALLLAVGFVYGSTRNDVDQFGMVGHALVTQVATGLGIITMLVGLGLTVLIVMIRLVRMKS